MKIRTIKERNCLLISGEGHEGETDQDYKDLFQLIDTKLRQHQRFSIIVQHTNELPPLIRHRKAVIDYCKLREEELETLVRGCAVVSDLDLDFFSIHARNSEVYAPPFACVGVKSRYDAFLWLDVLEEGDMPQPEEVN